MSDRREVDVIMTIMARAVLLAVAVVLVALAPVPASSPVAPEAIEPLLRAWLAAPDARVVAVAPGDAERVRVWAQGSWRGPEGVPVAVRAWLEGDPMLSVVSGSALEARMLWSDLALVLPRLWCRGECPSWQSVRLDGAASHGGLRVEQVVAGRRFVVEVPVRLEGGRVVAGPSRCIHPPGCFTLSLQSVEVWHVPRRVPAWLAPDRLELRDHDAVVLRRGSVPPPPGGEWR
jgi:hypothetical protein